MLYLCSHYYSLLFCSPSFPFSLRFLFCLPFHSFTLFSFCDYVILCDRMSCKCTAACGCVQLRVVACGCVWLRVASCGCVRLRVAACGCVWLRVAACGCVWCASYPKKNAKNATNTIFLFEKNEWFSPKQPPPPKK
jgi:hypothetical protein